MATFAQDSAGDLTLDFGKRLVLVRATDQQTAIKLRNRLLFFQGEWFIDTRLGMPYRTYLYVKNPQLPLLRQMFTKAILGCPGVKEILTLTLNLTPDRRMEVAMRVLLTSGAVLSTENLDRPFIITLT